MKIAFMVGAFPALSETFILNQITGLLDLGQEVEIFAQYNPREKQVHPEVEKYRLMERVHYCNMPKNKMLRSLKALYLIAVNFYRSPKKILRSLNLSRYHNLELFYRLLTFIGKRFDLIQCHFGPNGNLAVFLKEIGAINARIITTFHGYDIRLGISKSPNIYSSLFAKGDCFLAICSYNYEHLVRFGADPKKIIYYPLGIDTTKFAFRNRLRIEKDRLDGVKILTVARLVEEKGIKFSIEAVAKLKKELRFNYYIVGSGPLRSYLQLLINELGLKDRVWLIEATTQVNIINYMRDSDIFILPSVAEALPVVLLEAQAIGLPVIATDIGGMKEIVRDGESGFLVPAGDVDKMAERLTYLIEHPEIWSEMGRCGRKVIENKYDIEKSNQQLIDIYAGLIEHKYR